MLDHFGLVAPAIVGGDGAGASIFGTAAQQSRYAPSRLRSVFRNALGRGADAGRSDYAALFHYRLHFT
jgi:hypothetical protein